MFNLQMICMTCKDLEKEHPDYDAAAQAELEAVESGDYNYTGVGLPTELRPR